MSPPPTAPPIGSGRVVFARGAPSAAASTAKARLDLRDQTGVRIEELLVRLRPAAEGVDREQLRPRREVEALVRARHDRAVAALREQLLRLRRVEELHERVRRGLVLALRDDGDGIVDPDRRLRDVEVRLLPVVLRE